MTDAEYEALKTELNGVVDYWLKPSGLGFWRLSCRYVRDSGEFFVNEERKPETAACCKADWRYEHATISFNMPVMADEDKEDREYIVVHELMHIFLNEMREGGIDHEERVATKLGRAFLWMRKAHLDAVAVQDEVAT